MVGCSSFIAPRLPLFLFCFASLPSGGLSRAEVGCWDCPPSSQMDHGWRNLRFYAESRAGPRASSNFQGPLQRAWMDTVVSLNDLKMVGEFKASNFELPNMEGSGKLSLRFLTDILIPCVIKYVFFVLSYFKALSLSVPSYIILTISYHQDSLIQTPYPPQMLSVKCILRGTRCGSARVGTHMLSHSTTRQPCLWICRNLWIDCCVKTAARALSGAYRLSSQTSPGAPSI